MTSTTLNLTKNHIAFVRTAISLIQKQNVIQTDLLILGNGINKRRKNMGILSPTLCIQINITYH